MKNFKASRQNCNITSKAIPKIKFVTLNASHNQNQYVLSPKLTQSSQISILKINNHNNLNDNSLSTIHTLNNPKHKTSLQQLKEQLRNQLTSMTTIQKLAQIQHIFQQLKSLCKTYGYFIVTEAMLQFHPNLQNKISIWIHPNPQSTKPLHPIRKNTQFQSQLLCVAELKNIVNDLFTNINLGNAKTFTNIFSYINKFKNSLNNNQLSPQLTYSSKNNHQFSNHSKNNNKTNNLTVSLKTITPLNFHKNQSSQKKLSNPWKKIFNHTHYQTSSTPLSSIKSTQNLKKIKDKRISKTSTTISPLQSPHKYLNKQLPKKDKSKAKKLFSSQHKSTNLQIPTNISPLTNSNPQPQPKDLPKKPEDKQSQPFLKASQNKSNPSSNHLNLKASTTSMKQMTTSIQLQSEINNLFESNDNLLLLNSNYYSKTQQLMGVRNSMLSRVAEQFQDLF